MSRYYDNEEPTDTEMDEADIDRQIEEQEQTWLENLTLEELKAHLHAGKKHQEEQAPFIKASWDRLMKARESLSLRLLGIP